MIDQIAIGVCGVASVWLSQDERLSRRRFACIFGLLAQPFWFIATWKAQQYGIFALCALYTFSWLRGFFVHWVWRVK